MYFESIQNIAYTPESEDAKLCYFFIFFIFLSPSDTTGSFKYMPLYNKLWLS